MERYPILTIIGVPNTGKSTLFNRMIGERKSLVHSQPGMTRDVLRKKMEINGHGYYLQDTGGFFTGDDLIFGEVNKKIKEEAEKSDLIIFLFDGKRDMAGYEKELFLELKKMRKKIVPVINKVDCLDRYLLPDNYWTLKTDFIYLSAEHNLGIEDLLDRIEAEMTGQYIKAVESEKMARISIVGKPNVGKSSIINRILNHERLIVSPIPGTTRDSIDLEIRRNQKSLILVDNAGIRKLKKVKEETESAAVIRAEKNMKDADIIIFVVDVAGGIDQNDLLIAKKIVQSAKPVIIAGNKWDLIENRTNPGRWLSALKTRFNLLYFAPLFLISAKTGKNILALLDYALYINQKANEKIKVSTLNTRIKQILNEKKFMGSDKKTFNPKFISIESYRPLFIKFHTKTSIKLRPEDELYLKKKVVKDLKLEGIPVFFKTVSSR
jgi:GTPase